MHTENCSSVKLGTSEILSVESTVNNVSILEEDLALSSSTLGTEKRCDDTLDAHEYISYKSINNVRVVYLNEDTMDCNYSESAGTPKNFKTLKDPSSPDLFNSDEEDEPKVEKSTFTKILSQSQLTISPKKTFQSESVVKSDEYLLKRINKFLTGVPPPPSHTICQNDCTDFLNDINRNREYFWADPFKNEKTLDETLITKNLQKFDKCGVKTFPVRGNGGLRNLIHAFDACDASSSSVSTSRTEETSTIHFCENSLLTSSMEGSRAIMSCGKNYAGSETTSIASESNAPVIGEGCKRVKFDVPEEEYLGSFNTINENHAKCLPWPIIYQHRGHGIHYNRNRFIEDFENLSLKLCQRYVGNETQSTCTSWFTKQNPSSVKKRILLGRRNIGQSPGKRLSHLAKRRRTFSSVNLQSMAEKRQLVLNLKKPTIKKGKVLRGKSPHGKSPRGKSPMSSAKKRLVRRLSIEGSSPRKIKLETSKRALFQSPPTDHAGPSRINQNSQLNNPHRIKRTLFPTPKKKDDLLTDEKKWRDETKKRKSDEDLEGPKCKWARSLTVDCSHSLDISRESWNDKYSSTSSYTKPESMSQSMMMTGLTDINRRKLLFAVSDALRSKGVTVGHPKFKQYAAKLAKTVKKYMPDLENKNLPKKSGSTTDRMLKLAKTYVSLVIETNASS